MTFYREYYTYPTGENSSKTVLKNVFYNYKGELFVLVGNTGNNIIINDVFYEYEKIRIYEIDDNHKDIYFDKGLTNLTTISCYRSSSGRNITIHIPETLSDVKIITHGRNELYDDIISENIEFKDIVIDSPLKSYCEYVDKKGTLDRVYEISFYNNEVYNNHKKIIEDFVDCLIEDNLIKPELKETYYDKILDKYLDAENHISWTWGEKNKKRFYLFVKIIEMFYCFGYQYTKLACGLETKLASDLEYEIATLF